MHIPKRIHIGAHRYNVEYGEGNDPETIYLDPCMPQSEREVRFFEIAISKMNSKLSPEVIASLAEQIYDMLTENPFKLRG